MQQVPDFNYQHLFENAPDEIVIFDINGIIIDCNSTTQAFSGYSPEELKGKQFLSFVREPCREAALEAFQAIIQNRVGELETELIRKDGSIIPSWCLGISIYGDDGEFAGIAVFMRNTAKHKMIEQALRESEERLDLAMKGGELGYWHWNLQTGESYRDERWYEMLGYTADEIEPDPDLHFKLLHPDDREKQRKVWNDYLEGETDYYEVECRLKSKSGEWVWILDRGKIVEWDKTGKPLRSAGTHLNITGRKEAEQTLKESEERLRQVVENMPVMMTARGPDGNIVLWNHECERVTGYSADEMVGNPDVLNLLYPDPDYLEKIAQDWKKNGENYRDREVEVACRDGSERIIAWSSISANFPIKGWSNWTVGFDITSRKRSEELTVIQRDLGVALGAISGLDETLRLCLDAAIAVSGLDCGGIYLVDESSGDINITHHTGLSDDFINTVSHYEASSPSANIVKIGEPFYTQYNEIDVPKDNAQIVEGLQVIAIVPVKFEDRVIACLHVASHSESEIPSHSRYAIEAIANRIGGAITRARISEEIKKKNDELNAALKYNQELTSMVAHELRALLVPIVGYTDLLLDGSLGEIPEDSIEPLNIIRLQSDRLTVLIDDLLLVSRMARGELKLNMQSISATHCISECVAIYEQMNHGKPVEFEYIGDEFDIIADPTRLYQVLRNLIDNAIKYSDESVNITIKTEIMDNSGTISVSDNGFGIPDEHLQRIFDRFYRVILDETRRTSGIGLGLAITRDLVMAMGGTITAESERGKGTAFIICMPLA